MSDETPVPKVEKTLLGSLRQLYWDAAEREVRSMILFYNEIRNLEFDDDEEKIEIVCDNFKKMFDLWSKF